MIAHYYTSYNESLEDVKKKIVSNREKFTDDTVIHFWNSGKMFVEDFLKMKL